MLRHEAAPAPGKHTAWVLTALVHGLLAIFLFYGIRWQTHAPVPVEVELVSPPSYTPPVEKPPEPKPEPKPVPKSEPEPPPTPKPDIVLPKPKPEPEKPKPKEPPKEVEKPKEPPKAKEPPKPDPRLEQEKLLREQLANEARRIETTRRTQEQNAALEAELEGIRSNQAQAAQGKALAAWRDKIIAKVKPNIVVPPGASGNPEAAFQVSLLPDGGIIVVKLKKSTGNPALDAAIERAIHKSDPLPKPDDPSVFSRELNLVFRPLEQ